MSLNSRRAILGVGIPSCRIMPVPDGHPLNRGDRYQLLGLPRWEVSSSVQIFASSELKLVKYISKIYSSTKISSSTNISCAAKQKLKTIVSISGDSSLIITSSKTRIYSNVLNINCSSKLESTVSSKIFSGVEIVGTSSFEISLPAYRLYSAVNIDGYSSLDIVLSKLINFNRSYIYFPANIQKNITFTLSRTKDVEL